MMTLAEKLDLANGRPAGFDYMRIILALAIVFWHTILTTYGQQLQNSVWANPFYYSVLVWILPAFFTLSGFLVAGSLERCRTIVGFLFLRVIRIFPALIVEITLSALLLGPMLTKLPISVYFHHPELRRYFLNCIGDIHYLLPGLFSANPFPNIVNQQLWTVPYELGCYIALAVLGILGIAHHRVAFAAAVFLLFSICVFHLRHLSGNGVLPGTELIMCFLFGVLAYNFRVLLPHNALIAGVAFVAAVWLFLHPVGRFIAPLPLCYVIVFLGLLNPPRMAILESGDYSYGVYLYGFPIQQAVVATGWLPRNGWVNVAVSLVLVALLAACSWHLWEKHCLKLKHFRPAIDNLFRFTKPGHVVGQIYRLAVPAKG